MTGIIINIHNSNSIVFWLSQDSKRKGFHKMFILGKAFKIYLFVHTFGGGGLGFGFHDIDVCRYENLTDLLFYHVWYNCIILDLRSYLRSASSVFPEKCEILGVAASVASQVSHCRRHQFMMRWYFNDWKVLGRSRNFEKLKYNFLIV